jgi:hypothetical protein
MFINPDSYSSFSYTAGLLSILHFVAVALDEPYMSSRLSRGGRDVLTMLDSHGDIFALAAKSDAVVGLEAEVAPLRQSRIGIISAVLFKRLVRFATDHGLTTTGKGHHLFDFAIMGRGELGAQLTTMATDLAQSIFVVRECASIARKGQSSLRSWRSWNGVDGIVGERTTASVLHAALAD